MSESGSKKTTGKKTSSKLGHDPLAWIGPENVTESISENYDVKKEVSNNHDETTPNVHVANNSQTILRLPAYFGISQAETMHQDMQSILSGGWSKVGISGDEVESMDTSALQLVLSFVKEAKSTEIELSWISFSRKIENIAIMTNTVNELGLQV